MKILNFGSLNIDIVYKVDHIVTPGETISSFSCNQFCGGKGLNQSVSLAKAGANVYHAGCVGKDGDILTNAMKNAGVDINLLKHLDSNSGHAIIQIDENGQNSIILDAGANNCITKEYVDEVLSNFDEGDWILLQNEINNIDYIIDCAYEKNIKIALNPSPIKPNISKLPLDKISCFIMNEIEGKDITGKAEPEQIIEFMKSKYPNAQIVLTLGKDGSVYSYKEKYGEYPICKTKAVDTTAAGDTFTGYFLTNVILDGDYDKAMKYATLASSISVSRNGASNSIPEKEEVVQKYKDMFNK